MPAIHDAYPPEIIALRDGLDGFLKQEVIPRHERHAALLDDERRLFTDEGRYHPDALALIREVRMAAARAGYYAKCVPASLGGGGLGHLAGFGCSEHYWLGHYAISHWAFGPSAVLAQVSPRAREEMLVPMMEGRQSMCFGMSEPGAGSDAMMMKSRAVPDGSGWRLSGSKIWTTNSPYADYCIVFAVTNPERAALRRGGISAFRVPTASPGFVVERVIRMWGSAGGDEAVLHFDDIRIEPWQLVGELDKGFAIAMLGVNLGRLYNSARAVGQSRAALEKAFEYIKVREAFGHPIAEYQGVSFPLAESAMQMHAAHLMCLNAARLLDAGLPARKEVAMTKAFATQMGAQALDRVIQAHGAIGMTNELHLTEAWQSLRKVNIADGSNEILRRTIAREMLDGDMDW